VNLVKSVRSESWAPRPIPHSIMPSSERPNWPKKTRGTNNAETSLLVLVMPCLTTHGMLPLLLSLIFD